MTPELIGIMALFGSIVALGTALFGSLKWLSDRVDRRFEELERRMNERFDSIDKRFDSIDKRFERIEAGRSKLREGQARPEGMFEGAFERIPRVRTEDSEEAVASSGAAG